MKDKLVKESDYVWKLPKEVREGMNVDGRVIASKEMLEHIEDEAVQQLTNVSMMPGVIAPVIGLPDMHWGYGLPMGAVSAFDSENGIISAGLCGFDINCLSGDSQVLHEFGYTKNIKDFEGTFPTDRLICVNPTSKVIDTPISLFMKKKVNNRKVYRIKTEYGNEIVATGDHPILTEKGMVKLEELSVGNKISYFAFKGQLYEDPEEFTIVDVSDIKRESSKKALIELGLLPLKSTNIKLPYIVKLIGFALGDGHASKTKEGYGGLDFYSKEVKDLKEIQKDIQRLGFDANIHSRQREHNIDTFYGEINFEATENCLRMHRQPLFDLLEAAGLHIGCKVHNKFGVPSYLFKLPLWVKRLFLASLFGAELSSPKTVTKHGYNFYGPVLSLNKSESLLEDISDFLGEIRQLLQELGVESRIIKMRKEYLGKRGTTYRARLQISSKPLNLIRFYSEVGYEYNQKRKFLANVASAYLITKQNIYLQREKAIKRVQELKKIKKPVEIYDELSSEYVNKRFLIRSLYENRKNVRVSYNFQKFEEFLEEKTKGLGNTGQVWAKITSKEEIEYNDFVYDFTVDNEHHNFIANNLVVSNCGINLIRTNLKKEEVQEKLKELVDALFANIPCGVGSKGKLRLKLEDLDEVLKDGCEWAVRNGYGVEEDLKHIEENGKMEGGDPSKVSDLAKKRGLPQLGTLGAGNHFLEIQEVSELFDEVKAKEWGVEKGNVVIMLHCGSRGLGHQVATDYLKIQENAVHKYKIELPDKQLACAPVNSQEGKDFFAAMKCAVNYSFTNRLVMTQWIRETFEKVFGKKWGEMDMHTVYGLCHNVIKLEEHNGKEVYVHRKGATRSFPGQPVLIAGSMGTSSYLMVGTEKAMELSFGSSAHGAGRAMSRHQAIKSFSGKEIKEELAKEGRIVKATSNTVIAEEAPDAYKDVDLVIDSAHKSGISLKVAKLLPMAVCKG